MIIHAFSYKLMQPCRPPIAGSLDTIQNVYSATEVHVQMPIHIVQLHSMSQTRLY